MKRPIVFLFCAVLTMLLLSGPVAEAQTSNYAVLKAGAYFPNSGDLNGFNTGFNGEIAYGYYFNKNIAGELALGYFQSSGKGSASGSGYTASANGDIYSVPLTAALKAIYPMDKWEFYALGGIGAYYCNANVNGSITRGIFTFVGSDSHSDVSFGGFLGAGANLNLDKNWFIGVEGKYLWTKPQFSFVGQNIDVSFDGWTLTGNVGFRF
jgi:opacity protein-like surface antigen